MEVTPLFYLFYHVSYTDLGAGDIMVRKTESLYLEFTLYLWRESQETE